jgi:RluA family pseudouridine synthase
MEIIVKSDGELLDYLVNNIDMPRKKIKEYLTHGSIYVNNNRTTKYNYPVYSGNTIIIDTKSKNKVILPFEILFEDDHIIVVNKPSGLLTIATDNEKYNTLYHIVRNYLVSKNKNNRIFIVHRLDKDTSGVIIFAKDERTKNMLQDNWNDYVKLREYICVVHGKLEEKDNKIVNYLAETKTKLVYTTTKDLGVEAITNYEVVKENKDYSLVKVVIETGRRNQIRVTFKELGNPIVGDKTYGIKDNGKRLFLHADKLKLYYPVIGKDILFESKIPAEFKKIMKG